MNTNKYHIPIILVILLLTPHVSFAQQQVDIFADKTGNGSGSIFTFPDIFFCEPLCGSVSTSVDFNLELFLSAFAEPGSEFTSWGGDCAASCSTVSSGFRGGGGSSFTEGFPRAFMQLNFNTWFVEYTNLGPFQPNGVRGIGIPYNCTDFQGNTMNAAFNPPDFIGPIPLCN